MNTTALLIVLYMLLQFGIALWAMRIIKSENDYLLAGRGLGVFMASFSLFATWFGAETVMGSSAAIAEEGLAGSRADPFGYALCLLLMAGLVAFRLRQKNLVTIGDFFRERFSRRTEVLAVLVMLPTSLAWAAAQLLAFSQVLAVVLDTDVQLCLILSTVLVITYTCLGGLLADVVTDVVQGLFLIAGLIVLLFFVVADAGGVGASVALVQPEQLSFIAPEESWLARLDSWLIPILGSLVAQEALVRLLASRTPEIARRASVFAAGIYLCVGLVPVVIALVGTHLAPELGHQDEFLPALAGDLLPRWCFVIFAGALISAILSTVDSTLLTFASLLSHNIILPAVKRRTGTEVSERNKVRVARGIVAGAGVMTYLVATSGDTIYGLVELSSSFGVAGLLVTFIFGLRFAAGGEKPAMASIAAGLVMTVLAEFFFAWEAPFLYALAVAGVVYGAGVALEKGGRAHQTVAGKK